MLFGVPRETAADWLGAQPEADEEFAVWSDNWPTVTLFLALQTQWHIVQGAAGGLFTGLDYAAADAAMRMLAIPRRERPETFAGLCHMERAALPILNRPRESA